MLCIFYFSQYWQWEAGLIAVLFAVLLFINDLNNIPLVSAFLPLNSKFILKIFRIFFYAFIILFTFGYAFHLLLGADGAFISLNQSFVKTLVWFLGDLGYDDTFIEKDPKYPVLTNLIFVLFVSVIIGFITNMAISHPSERYRTHAELGKYASCLDLFTTFDAFIVHSPFKLEIEAFYERKSDSLFERIRYYFVIFEEDECINDDDNKNEEDQSNLEDICIEKICIVENNLEDLTKNINENNEDLKKRMENIENRLDENNEDIKKRMENLENLLHQLMKERLDIVKLNESTV